MSSLKYKLINNQTKEEHLCDKVTIDRFDYYVGNEIAGFTYNKPTYNSDGRIGLPENNQSRKIIATNNPNIDIPKVVDEAERLAESIIPNLPYKKYVKTGFIGGYNKSQETHSFSEEDMIEFAHFYFREEFNSTIQDCKSTEEIFQLWKEQQPKILYYETN